MCELIWNALDADATEIEIDFTRNSLGAYDSITVTDNGHGLSYSKVENVFGRLGGSEKKLRSISPNGRSYHGKEGKGRYKSLSLGTLVQFDSTVKNAGGYERFETVIDANNLSRTKVGDPRKLPPGEAQTGFKVAISNLFQKAAEQAVGEDSRAEYRQRFASYYQSYPVFKISFNGEEIDFEGLIQREAAKEIKVVAGSREFPFTVKVVEWNFDSPRKTFWCNEAGIPLLEGTIGIRASSLPISVFIQSAYIEEQERNGNLQLGELDEVLNEASKAAKTFARSYVRARLADASRSFIQELKDNHLYPYEGEPENIVEESQRQVFDIIALQVHSYLPSFDEQDERGKKLVMALLKQALETDGESLQVILSEVVGLPRDKRDELAEILVNTPLSNIIDTMTEIKNRLKFLNGLEEIIYNPDLNKNIRERKHLHKIIAKETWIFGDNYTYGVDDVTLKNVLKAYLRDALERDDFEQLVESGDNSELNTIPDVCLWHQFSLGSAGKENLVIELKRPNLDAGLKEHGQILSYASRVSNDPRFPKDRTRWRFLLITKDVKSELEPQLRQKNRTYGHVSEGDNYDVYVLPWGHILSEAKQRHEYLRDALNLNLQDNEQGLGYLREKYSEYLPAEGDELNEDVQEVPASDSDAQDKSVEEAAAVDGSTSTEAGGIRA